MRVFAYCARDFIVPSRRAAGVEPVSCPPTTCDTLDLAQLEGNDLIMFNLHGIRKVGAFFGNRDGPPVALLSSQVKSVNLGGAVVYAPVCYLGEDDNPMLDALLDAGASAVIAGHGRNYGGTSSRLVGVDLLGLWIRRGLQAKLSPESALRLSRLRLRLSASMANADARGFEVFRKR